MQNGVRKSCEFKEQKKEIVQHLKYFLYQTLPILTFVSKAQTLVSLREMVAFQQYPTFPFLSSNLFLGSKGL